MTKQKLIKKLHALCGKNHIDEETRKAMVAGYGKESSKDMTISELVDLCVKIEGDAKKDEMDRWRKRVIASVGAYLKAMDYVDNIDAIKATVCRAAKADRFNAIPLDKLRSIYNAFKRRKNMIDEIDGFIDELIAGTGIRRNGR